MTKRKREREPSAVEKAAEQWVDTNEALDRACDMNVVVSCLARSRRAERALRRAVLAARKARAATNRKGDKR